MSENILETVYNKFSAHPTIGRRITELDANDSAFYTFLRALDLNADGDISEREFELASQLLARLRNVDTASLRVLNDIIQALDVNGNTAADPAEVTRIDRLFNDFAGAESANNTLNVTELQALLTSLSA